MARPNQCTYTLTLTLRVPIALSVAFGFLFMAGIATASDGMNPIAFDTRSAAMGGASTALGGSALSLTSNPAGIALSKANLDFNITLLKPSLSLDDRVMTPNGAMMLNSGKAGESQLFPLFGIAYAMPVYKNLYAGLGIFVQGGMGADFKGINTFTDPNPMVKNGDNEGKPGAYDVKSQVMFIKIAPTIAYRIENFILGAAVHIGVAKMDWTHTGLQFPEPDGDNLFMGQHADFAGDYALGVAGSFGALVNLFDDRFSFGLTFTMQTKPTFKGTLTLNGAKYTSETDDFGWARQVAFGVSGKLLKKRLVLSGDFRWVDWSSAVRTVQFSAKANDPGSLPQGQPAELELPFQMNWQDSLVVALGAEYAVMKDFLFVRGGYNWGRAPATGRGINALFPPVTEHHITAGLGVKHLFDTGLNLNFAFEYALPGKVKSNNKNQQAFQPTAPGQTPKPNGYSVDVEMKQISIYLGVGYDFS